MSHTKIHEWIAPIDEVLSQGENRKPDGPFSLNRLKKIGVENAIKLVQKPEKKNTVLTCDILHDLKKLEGRIRYIQSGSWISARDRKKKCVEALENPSKSVQKFIEAVVSKKPKTLLDLASGSGSSVTSLAYNLPADTSIFAVERDLKCLWIIQEKFRMIKRSNNSEAIGGDVRELPFQDESMDVVSSIMALQEISGISIFLREIKRVLKDDGSYFALLNREPWLYGIISLDEYKAFAEVADLYSGIDALIGLALKTGLTVTDYKVGEKDLCLVEIRKAKK
ncbi:class I SAM-dependent methyltransferase [candidate division WOR-3 bacterium]|nr:class I SAM-dependent methyltransferase [candidate division WOR-3 bacterium]